MTVSVSLTKITSAILIAQIIAKIKELFQRDNTKIKTQFITAELSGTQ